MGSPERIYRGAVRALSFLFLALGLVIFLSTLVAGGGPLSVGFLLGVAFLVLGAARLRMSRH